MEDLDFTFEEEPIDTNIETNKTTELTSNDREMGMLAHLLSFVGIVGPLVIWLIKKDESTFVDHHGKESLNFQITLIIGMLVGAVTSFFIVGVFLIFGLMIYFFVCTILAAMAAYRGEMYKYPFCIRFIK